MALLDLEGLRELQDCANYLLDHCPEARESLCQQGKENWIEQVSEASLIMLDVCNVSKDVMALVRHGLQDLQLTLLFVAEVLKEVRRAVVTMVESLFSLVCVPWLERKPSIGSFSSIFTMQFCCFDDAWDEVAMRSASTRLEAAEITVEELEIELECIFRRLIQTRVSLLNILTAKTSPV
uniref:At1g20520 n=1 Tax=Arabidopsis thaliana TaxID=3702 RepID=Q5PP64_ARATH|nr:At1g20520 [Arabidopsis thaliana]